MTLNSSQKRLITETVPILKEHGVTLTEYFYQRMLSNNPTLKEVFNMRHQTTGQQARALANTVLAYAENIDSPEALLPTIHRICEKHVSLNIQAPDYKIVGENLLCSISEVLKVPLDSELISAWELAYQALAELMIKTEQKLYVQNKEKKGGWLGWRSFKITNKVAESKDVSSFYLEPSDGDPLPLYKAGQYITLNLFIPELGYKQPRQYSLSECSGKPYFRISVKHEQQGYVSHALHQLNIGDSVDLSAPIGDFFLKNQNRPQVFISAGVGLTPMLAMLNQLIKDQCNYPIYFIHATHHALTHSMKEDLQQQSIKHDHLKLYICYESPTKHDVLGKDYHHQGRLNLKLVPSEFLSKQAEFYLCGPVPFMHAQYQSLLEYGIEKTQIHSEAFTTGAVNL